MNENSAAGSVVDALPRTIWERVRRFARISAYEKSVGIAKHWRVLFPRSYVLLRLPTRVWWLAGHSALDKRLTRQVYHEFERAELKLVARILRPGMTVVDIGAHH